MFKAGRAQYPFAIGKEEMWIKTLKCSKVLGLG